jgi:hypothetical protein
MPVVLRIYEMVFGQQAEESDGQSVGHSEGHRER